MSGLSWSDLSGFLKDVTKLTINVSQLQDEMTRLIEVSSAQKDQIRDLQEEVRVLRLEIQSEATKAAMSTVIDAHVQIIDRVNELKDKGTSNTLKKAE